MVLLILESLSSTELLFILVMALVLFGPRKLPQLSRSLGKNLAEFRRASEDFKRTWERELNFEETNRASTGANHAVVTEEGPIMDQEEPDRLLQAPMIETVTPDRVIARHSAAVDAVPSPDTTGLESDRSNPDEITHEPKPMSKQDWL